MMKATLFIVALGIWVGEALASPTQPEIVLLTSIKNTRLERKMERIFTRKMRELAKKGWKIEVRHRADAFDLHQALMKDSVDGLIWVSHGAFKNLRASREAGDAIAAKPMLLDYRGDDVAPVLSMKHDELKFLSVVGCNSKQILEYQIDPNGPSSEDTALETYIPDHKVIAQWALRRASKKSARFFLAKKTKATNEPMDTNPKTLETIQIVRKIPTDSAAINLRSLRVYLGGRLLGLIPSGQPGETQTVSLEVPDEIAQWTSPRWKIRIETGQSVETPSTNIVFGELQFQTQRGLRYEVFSDESGQPFGQNFRVYLPLTY